MRLVVDAVTFAHPRSATLLEHVDLTAEPGESIAIVGPSGSGKTTLLALLGGLLRPTAGRVYLQDDARELAVDSQVSWVLQTVNVLGDRSVLDNVAVGAFADGLDRSSAEERARTALAQVGLAHTVSRPVRTLSGGEAQRVVIARAAVSECPVLLADEPTGQLDQKTSSHVIDALLAAAAERIAVVVTHDDAVAQRCSRILSLGAGRISERAVAP